jgi:hypothetical protein
MNKTKLIITPPGAGISKMAASRQQLPGARWLPNAEGVFRLLRLAALDVPISLSLAEARDHAGQFSGRPLELFGGGMLELIGPRPRSGEA